ncbi:hypothetical protein AYY17_12500 [Morganella psychrotolerans]|uniref:Uncharacterized protein n=1 Tax=Morganella psychrotolerans TaxID=368603 RepID=A0A1B8H057_9GAMM|nr:hypothetical protein AYY17_12500 [Morganella psychrotolerans]
MILPILSGFVQCSVFISGIVSADAIWIKKNLIMLNYAFVACRMLMHHEHRLKLVISLRFATL